MAAISGTDLALTTARVGAARVGSFRVGFIPCATTGPGSPWFGEYIWDELKPPTTQWTLLTEDCVCGQHPEASFSNVLCNAVGPVAFTDTSTPIGEITSWYWDFGDGGTSTDQNPTHVYAAGFFTVTLYVSGEKGTGSATGYVSVMSALVASADPSPVDQGADVTFDAGFSGGLAPYTYLWDFGDALPRFSRTGLHCYWALNEANGTRAKTYGSSVTGDLSETGGAVPAVVGQYGNAVSSTEAQAGHLVGTFDEVDLAATGFTIAMRLYWAPKSPTVEVESLIHLWSSSGGAVPLSYPNLAIVRYFDTDYVNFGMTGRAGSTVNIAQFGNGVPGPFIPNAWNFLIFSWDAATGQMLIQTNDPLTGTRGGTPLVGTYSAANFGSTGFKFDSIDLLGKWANSGIAWQGYVDEVALWARVLTTDERAIVFDGNSRLETPVYQYQTAGVETASVTVTSSTGCTATDTVDVTVTPTSTVEGTITLDGLPWAGDVSMTVDAVPWPGGVATTDGSGFYQFLSVPAGAIEVTCGLGSNAGVTVPPATLVLDIVSVS